MRRLPRTVQDFRVRSEGHAKAIPLAFDPANLLMQASVAAGESYLLVLDARVCLSALPSDVRMRMSPTLTAARAALESLSDALRDALTDVLNGEVDVQREIPFLASTCERCGGRHGCPDADRHACLCNAVGPTPSCDACRRPLGLVRIGGGVCCTNAGCWRYGVDDPRWRARAGRIIAAEIAGPKRCPVCQDHDKFRRTCIRCDGNGWLRHGREGR